MIKEELWIKKGPAIIGFGPSLIIMAVGMNGQRNAWGEFHIFVPGKFKHRESYRHCFDLGSVPEDLNMINNESFCSDIEYQANTKLSVFYSTIDEATLAQSIIGFSDGEKKDIARIWMQGDFCSDLLEIKNKTQSTELMKFIADIENIDHLIKPFN